MDAQRLLRRLGATGNLKGFHYAAYMIQQVTRDPMAVTLITKRLYPATAQRFGTTEKAVERSVRTLVRTCWEQGDRELLQQLAGGYLPYRPTNGAFLDITAAYLRQQE